MTATINGNSLTTLRLSMPEVGAWHADVVHGGEESFTEGDSAVLDLYGQQFVGVAFRSTLLGGRVRTKVVGGKGRMSRELEAAHYTDVTAQTVIQAILSGAGETLSSESTSSVLEERLDTWDRASGMASRALQRVCDYIGAEWRVLADGSVWVGVTGWPSAELEHRLIDEDWGAGSILIAPEAPELRPGVVLYDQKIRYVVHTVEDRALRTEAWLQSPMGALERFLAGIRTEIDYSRFYPATVARQAADGTLEVKPDDSRIAGSGGMSNVPLRTGVPGLRATLPQGARVRVGFDAGDPARPFAALPDDGSGVTALTFDSGQFPVARAGDQAQVLPAAALPVVLTFTTTPVSGANPATLTMLGTLAAMITTGKANFTS